MSIKLDNNIDYKWVVASFLLFLLVSLLPIFIINILPLHDYPNHLARMHILVNYDRSEFLQKYYILDWAPIPNLAMDLFVPTLAKILPLEVSGKIFVALCIVFISTGVIALHYALHRQISLYPLILFIFLYNQIFMFGFMNYIFSIGIFLHSFAAWIFLRNKRIWISLLFTSIMSIILYFSHIHGFGLYVVSVVGYEVGQYWKNCRLGSRPEYNQLIISAAQCIIPVILFIFYSPLADKVNSNNFNYLMDKWHYFNRMLILKEVIYSYNDRLDAITIIFLLALILCGLLFKKICISKDMYTPLFLISIIHVLMPTSMLSSWYVGERVLIALVFLFIAASDWCLRSKAWRFILVSTLVCLFIGRTGVIMAHWRVYDRQYQEILAAFEILPKGSRLNHAIAYRGPAEVMRRPSLNFIACFAVIRKDAFVPGILAIPGGQPIRLTQLSTSILKGYPGMAFPLEYMTKEKILSKNPFDENLLNKFDYILIINEEDFPISLPDNLIPVFSGTNFRLFRIAGRNIKS